MNCGRQAASTKSCAFRRSDLTTCGRVWLTKSLKSHTESRNTLRCLRLLGNHCHGALQAVDDRGVVATTKPRPNLHQLHPQHFTHQVHSELSWNGQVFRTRLGPKSLRRD